MNNIINTHKCNFRCDHCLSSCGPSNKKMIETEHIIKFLEEYNNGSINYYGGETFLHPQAIEQLVIISRYAHSLRVVTNGSLMLTSKGNRRKWWNDFLNNEMYEIISNTDFTICLSKDIFHDEEWYKRSNNWDDIHNELKYISHDYCNFTYEEDRRNKMINKVYPIGRALETGFYDHEGECILDYDFIYQDRDYITELSIDPYGNLFICCNEVGYIGHINDSYSSVLERYKKVIKKQQKNCLSCSLLKHDKKEVVYGRKEKGFSNNKINN